MTTDLPPIPPAVIEFAQSNGYKNIKPNEFCTASVSANNFNDYKVYDVNDKDGYFRFILVKKDEIRFAKKEETKKNK